MTRIAITTDTHYGYDSGADKKNVQMLEEIGKQSPDVLIHCGDDSSNHPKQVDEYWGIVRRVPGLETIPIFITPGNHQLWYTPWDDCPHLTVQEVRDEVKSHWSKHNITHLHGESFKKDNVLIVGFDSWYSEEKRGVPTNDCRYSPGLSGHNSHEEWLDLQKRSDTGFHKCLDIIEEEKKANKDIVVILYTHMGFIKAVADNDWKAMSSGVYFGSKLSYEQFTKDVSYILFGHSHSEESGTINNGLTKYINVGSDYNFPKFQILEV